MKPDPGPYPAQGQSSNPEYAVIQTQYAWHKREFDNEQLLEGEIKAALLLMVPPAVREQILPPTHATMSLDAPSTFRIIHARYNQVTPVALTAIQTALDTPFSYSSPTSIEEHFSKHERLQRLLVTLRFATSTPLQVQTFRRSIQLSPDADAFTAAFDYFDITHPDPATHLLADFIVTARSAIPKLLAKHLASPPGQIYAANAATNPVRRAKSSAPTTPIPSPYWCWSHGPGHSSDHCKHPHPGHQVTATITNKLGSKC